MSSRTASTSEPSTGAGGDPVRTSPRGGVSLNDAVFIAEDAVELRRSRDTDPCAGELTLLPRSFAGGSDEDWSDQGDAALFRKKAGYAPL